MPAPGFEAVCLVEKVWRVGFQPTPWAWSGWEWASNGRFPGRWDDLEGNFRTVYAGSSLLGCLLEVLACFRKDPRLALDLADIAEDDQDKVLYPSVAPGTVPLKWLDGRTAATALMSGTFCAVTATESVASHIYATGDFHSVQFTSRHGDDLRLWAIFEQPGDPFISPRLGHMTNQELHPDTAGVLEAFRLLGLKWEEQ